MLNNLFISCLYVSENSKDVKINYCKIDVLLEELKIFKNKHYLLSNPFGIMDLDSKDLISFLLLYDAIDFSFWSDSKWSIDTGDKVIDGGYALLYCMLSFYKKNKDENIFIRISKMTDEEIKQIFLGINDTEIPLLTERVKILKNISSIVVNKMNSDFYSMIDNICVDTELFNFIVTNFPSFKDERLYNDKNIYFYKLAQLLTSDILHIREFKESIKVDYSHLIGCADYKIPQVLRELGILEYSNKLAKIIDYKQEIMENSPYEVEIRANTLVVINYIAAKLDYNIDRIDINDFIWLKGKDKNNTKRPYHLTRTSTY